MKASGSLAGLLVLGWASALAAQPSPRLALLWSAPPGCPSGENVQARVDALLGGGASASVADVRAFGQVERVDNGFRLVLNMGIGSTPSSRVFEARTCEELAGAAAIAIALLARSSVDSASSPPAGDSTAEGSPPPTKQPPPAAPVAQSQDPAITKKEPEAESASSPSSPLQLVIDAPVGVAVWGSLPSVGFGIGAAAGLRWRALRITAGGEWWH